MDGENGTTEETVIEQEVVDTPKVYSTKQTTIVVNGVSVEISREAVERRLDDADTIKGLMENAIAVKVIGGETTLDDVFGV